jgi:type II secretory pathway pseudopilin PulG
VGILIMVAISAILLGKAAESWESQVWRDREAELIFRGEQYKQAIETFYTNQRRLPTKLEELLDVEPRSIRRLYKDPMNPDGEWVLLHADASGKRIPREPVVGREFDPDSEHTKWLDKSGPRRSRVHYSMPGQKSRQQLSGGTGAFIIGVASSATRDTIQIYNGASTAAEWEFVATIRLPQSRAERRGRTSRHGRGRRTPRGRGSDRKAGPGKPGISRPNP